MASGNSRISERLGAEGLFHDIGFTARTDSLDDNVKKYLLPGTYVAELEGNPFVENALGPAASPKRTRTTAVVYGVLDSPENQ